MAPSAEQGVIDGYAADAPALIPRFEALSSEAVLAPAMALLPTEPCRVLEVGAGTGRDAAWLASRGHRVVAVEPVAALREAGMALHPSPNITWMDDRLPDLAEVRRRGEAYDLILAIAVWQHLRPEHHARAIASLAALTAAKGRLILSLREGPGAPTRPCFPACPAEINSAAKASGLTPILHRRTPSIQQANRDAGVTWCWLGFERGSA